MTKQDFEAVITRMATVGLVARGTAGELVVNYDFVVAEMAKEQEAAAAEQAALDELPPAKTEPEAPKRARGRTADPA